MLSLLRGFGAEEPPWALCLLEALPVGFALPAGFLFAHLDALNPDADHPTLCALDGGRGLRHRHRARQQATPHTVLLASPLCGSVRKAHYSKRHANRCSFVLSCTPIGTDAGDAGVLQLQYAL